MTLTLEGVIFSGVRSKMTNFKTDTRSRRRRDPYYPRRRMTEARNPGIPFGGQRGEPGMRPLQDYTDIPTMYAMRDDRRYRDGMGFDRDINYYMNEIEYSSGEDDPEREYRNEYVPGILEDKMVEKAKDGETMVAEGEFTDKGERRYNKLTVDGRVIAHQNTPEAVRDGYQRGYYTGRRNF
jgi:hypothetical protein